MHPTAPTAFLLARTSRPPHCEPLRTDTPTPVPDRRQHELTVMLLLVVALFGLLVPNGFFVYWLLFEFDGVRAVLNDHLAIGFILDCILVLVILSVYFARHPIGRL